MSDTKLYLNALTDAKAAFESIADKHGIAIDPTPEKAKKLMGGAAPIYKFQHTNDLFALCRDFARVLLAAQPSEDQRDAVQLLAENHTGMRVDYHGLFRQSREALRQSPALAEMLRQFEDHIRELGQRWYAGDTAVVDEILQLYCVEAEARAAIAKGEGK